MKAFDGQDIIDLYVSALTEQPSVTKDQIDYYIGNTGYTQITEVTKEAEGFQFRMETQVFRSFPICQYVIVTGDGEMKFRDNRMWFVPGDADMTFNTYSEALEYLISLEKPGSMVEE